MIFLKNPLVDIKLLVPDWPVPEYKTSGSAGVDLRANIPESVLLKPGGRKTIGTGIAVHLDDPGLVGFVFPRSGLGTRGLILANSVGVIDSDYTGEIRLAMVNAGEESIEICPGDRVAQLVVVNTVQVRFMPQENLERTTRGSNGFGSTGRH